MIDKDSKIYTFYKLIFPNDKVYVGMTWQKVEERWSNGKGYKTQPLYREILKYGWDNIRKETIPNLTRDEARKMEQDGIKYYTNQGRCYNLSKGGECGGDKVCEFEYNGEVYNSEELARLSNCNLTGHDITTRINGRGKSIEEALNKPKIKKNQTVEYKGKMMTFKELSKISPTHVTPSAIATRINHHGWDVERAIMQPMNVKLQPFGVTGYKYNYNGKEYSMYELWQMRKIDNLSQAIIQNRINCCHWDIDKALSTPVKGRNVLFEYNGNMYTSTELEKICKIPGVTRQTINDRIQGGWSVEKAITTPIINVGAKLYRYHNKEYTLKELIKFAKYDSLSINTLRNRIKKGWDIQEALDTPPKVGNRKK